MYDGTMRSSLSHVTIVLGFLLGAAASGCRPSSPSGPPAAKPSSDAAFTEVATAVLEDLYRRHPTQATFLGIHKYDDRLEDSSRQAVMDEIAALRGFRDRVAAVDAAGLTDANRLDREQL